MEIMSAHETLGDALDEDDQIKIIPQLKEEARKSIIEEIKTATTKSQDQLNETSSSDSLNFLFHISDIDTTIDRKAELRKVLYKKFGMLEEMSEREFETEVKKICNCCLKHIKDLHELHVKRTAVSYAFGTKKNVLILALDMLDDVITRMNISYVKTHHVVHLVWSVMSCMHHFQLRFRTGTQSLIAWTRKKKAEACMTTFTKLIYSLPKSVYRVVLNSLIIFYKEGRLWTIEFRLTEMICQLLYLYGNIEEAIEDILVTAEHASLHSDIEPRMMIKVLYEVLEQIRWNQMSDDMLKRFLVMLRKSIEPKAEHVYRYTPMKMGLNICVRNITKNLSNSDLMNLMVILVTKITTHDMEDTTLLEFGSIGEYAALRYHTLKFSDSIPDELLENLMIMMTSDNPFHHLFSNRILQNIMDRHNNRLEFETPRIFFRGVKYNITVARYSARDRQYYKKYRLAINRVMMAGLRQHYFRRLNLENIFTNLAITCVEIPCSYVASSIVSFAMAMQEYFLITNPPDMVSCHHVHAMVMSLMSLVCYVHKAEIFYNYIAEIMERRSDMAPQLNPPIRAVYTYAQNHILWNKPDLFFEDWEVRYGLWKCFRTASVGSLQDMVPQTMHQKKSNQESRAKKLLKGKVSTQYY